MKRDGCTGKKRHPKKWGAEIHIKKLQEPGMRAYHCHKCGFWHIGHRHPQDGFQSRLDRLIGADPRNVQLSTLNVERSKLKVER